MMRFTVNLDFGPDLGQNFGSLFEATTPDGTLTLGAGFVGVYNTRFRGDRYGVQFFVRPAQGDRPLGQERLPRPGTDAGVYMFDLDGRLYAHSHGADNKVRSWSPDAASWVEDGEPVPARMRVGGGLLVLGAGQARYNGEIILDRPQQGSYDELYYANGHLCFYHRHDAGAGGYRDYESDDKGFSRLHAVPWDPASGKPADVGRAATLTTPYVNETTFSWGQFGDQVVTGSNLGGFYVFENGAWQMLKSPELGVSFQIYSMINYQDKLLMAQYPSGHLWEYDGKAMRELQASPPGIEGVARYAREAQTTGLYGGDLYVGVWPWGELWRLNPATDKWSFAGRMFTQPELTDKTGHPYENECTALGIVANQWGQRVTGLVPLGDGLMLSTSAKWPCTWEPRFEFVGNDRWKEYGSVIALRTPGHLSAPVRWREGATALEFAIEGDSMRISQDGEEIGVASLGPELSRQLNAVPTSPEVTWGQGLFGRFRGRAVTGSLAVRPVP